MQKKNINTIIITVTAFISIIILIFVIKYIFFKNTNTNINKTSYDVSNFSNSYNYKLIMFYAPWCGFSQQALIEYNKLDNKFITNNNKIVLIEKIDCDSNEDKCNSPFVKKPIPGYPTIRLYKKNDENFEKDFEYQRTESAIKSWLDQQAI